MASNMAYPLLYFWQFYLLPMAMIVDLTHLNNLLRVLALVVLASPNWIICIKFVVVIFGKLYWGVRPRRPKFAPTITFSTATIMCKCLTLDRFGQMVLNFVVLICILAPVGTFTALFFLVGSLAATIVSMITILFLTTFFATCMPSNAAYPLFYFLEFYLLLMAMIMDPAHLNNLPRVLVLVVVALVVHFALLAMWCVVLKTLGVETGLLGAWAGVFLGVRDGFRTVMTQILGSIYRVVAFVVDFCTCQCDFPLLRTHDPAPAIPATMPLDLDLELTPMLDVSPPPPYIDIVVSSPVPLTSKISQYLP